MPASLTPDLQPPDTNLLKQRVCAVDDLVMEIATVMDSDDSFSPGLVKSIHQLLLSSETARMAVLVAGDSRVSGSYMDPLLVAARRTYELARRGGRSEMILLMLLQTVMRTAEQLHRELKPA